ncbi:MAG: hypothetical protein R2716_09740 [Microthrixaceae bacterium]
MGEKPYLAQQSMLDPMDLEHACYWKTEFLPGVSEGYCDTFADAALKVASPLSFSVIFHLAGAVKQRRR